MRGFIAIEKVKLSLNADAFFPVFCHDYVCMLKKRIWKLFVAFFVVFLLAQSDSLTKNESSLIIYSHLVKPE